MTDRPETQTQHSGSAPGGGAIGRARSQDLPVDRIADIMEISKF